MVDNFYRIGKVLNTFEKMNIRKIEASVGVFKHLYSKNHSLEFLEEAFIKLKRYGNIKLNLSVKDLCVITNLDEISFSYGEGNICVHCKLQGNITKHYLYLSLTINSGKLVQFYDLLPITKKRGEYIEENQIAVFPFPEITCD